jgi:hypothetical protein
MDQVMQSISSCAPICLWAQLFMESIGQTTWAIPEGYIPGQSHGPAPEMTSHEACCVLNASETNADVAITIFL